jgi:hypothetical protein
MRACSGVIPEGWPSRPRLLFRRRRGPIGLGTDGSARGSCLGLSPSRDRLGAIDAAKSHLLSRVLVRWVALLVPLALLAPSCGGHDRRYAGVDEGDARSSALEYVRKLPGSETLMTPEAVRSRTPGGHQAWLVRVPFAGDSSDACVYVWRGADRIERRLDGSCRHWNY